LVTEISAGWYRYASHFELYNNGEIKPIFQFSAVRNSCVCYSHNHHVYWRFDFDLNGRPNSIQVSDGETYRPINREASFIKNLNNQAWRINNTNGDAYEIIPGDNDGLADSYALADAWALRYYSTQIDDNNVRTSTRAALNRFVTGESLENQDLVFWYSGHYGHSNDGLDDFEVEVGPTLRPDNLSPKRPLE